MPAGSASEPAALRSFRVGLLWHSLTSGNLGIGALTFSNVALVESVAHELGLEARFVVLSMQDGETPSVIPGVIENHVVTMRTLLSPWGFWGQLRRLDCVLDIGTGDSFTDTYGLKRFLILCITKAMATIRGVPLILSPQTIGPFERASSRVIARLALRRARAIVSRDAESLAVARQLAPAVPAVQSIDVTFGLPFTDRSAERGSARLRVGVNVSGLLFHQAETGANRFGMGYDYASFSRRLLARLVTRPGTDVHLVTHATSRRDATDDDSRLADRLAREFPSAIRVPDFDGPVEAKSFISSLDFLVAARMHACIAAFSAGTPLVPVAYSRKFSGLFSSLGFDRIVPVRGWTEDEAIAFVLASLEDRAAIRTSCEDGMERTGPLLDAYRDVLRTAFSQISSGGSGVSRPDRP